MEDKFITYGLLVNLFHFNQFEFQLVSSFNFNRWLIIK